MLMNAYTPALYESLGVFIPLIVVNCIILGRAESFASKNGVVDSILDALGMGLGYTLAVTSMSLIREVLSTGMINLVNPFDETQVLFNIRILPDDIGLGGTRAGYGLVVVRFLLANPEAAHILPPSHLAEHLGPSLVQQRIVGKMVRRVSRPCPVMQAAVIHR